MKPPENRLVCGLLGTYSLVKIWALEAAPAILGGARTQMITGVFVAKRSAAIVAKNVSTWFIFGTVRGNIVATSHSCVLKAAAWPGKLSCAAVANDEDTGDHRNPVPGFERSGNIYLAGVIGTARPGSIFLPDDLRFPAVPPEETPD
jgi:hypothetical protein